MDSVVSPDGEVWFIDFNNYVVRAIDASGEIRTVVGNGELGDSPASDGLTSVAALDAFNNHTPSMMFADGYLYLAAWHESRIKRVSLSGMVMENFAARGVRTHYDGDGGPALLAALDLPSSVAVDPAGNVAIMDQANQVVRTVDKNNVMHTIAGQCVVEDTPCAVGVPPVACPGSGKLACGELAVECMNACTPSYGGDGGPALQARLSEPFGQAADPSGRIAYDHAGNLLIADTGNHRLRKVDPAGTITTLAGTGVAGYAGDGGPANEAQINHPVDIAVADDNTIYFTDVFNSCVRKIDPGGTISTVVGQCSPDPADRGFAGDGGAPLAAKLDRPYGIDLVGSKLYVSDSYNNRLRVVNLP
jgi:sugar lactone lactonase YvrE